MSEFNKYSTDGGANFIDVEDSNAVHWGDQSKGYVGKNLLENKLVNGSGANITWKVNSDKTVDVNTSNPASSTYSAEINTLYDFNIGDSFKLSGCPTGGGESSYNLFLVCRDSNNTATLSASEYGSGYTFTVPANTVKIMVYLRIMSGATLSNKVFKPMLTNSSVPDSDYAHYEPYLTSNRELTNVVNPIGTFETTYTSIATTTTANAWTHLASFTLPKGKWIISVGGRIKNGTANTIKSLAIGVSNTDSIRAVSSFQADTGIMNLTMPFNNTSEQTVYVNAYTTESLEIAALTIDRIRII